ncbi:right-handed parallel beta-helix repeat-containing protein [candidate division KSB1 bacterium]|nr:right-handed parallel beta-helix repeat-containing protein [candidate division KSB1 bacterium]
MKNLYITQLRSYVIILFIISFFVDYGFCDPYQPPIGIPKPDFGIEETVENVYGDGYYTYYIDNTDSNATDEDNPNGTVERPRKTIPQYLMDLPAGNVVEIHGGPYTFYSTYRWTPQGTREKPVFIRGGDAVNKPQIIGFDLEIGGQYLIVENLELYKKAHIAITKSSPSHVAVRNCEIHNPEGALSGFGTAIYAGGTDVVVYRNHIHHNWKGDDLDCHGVVPAPGARRVWVLENHIHHNSGDAFQATHGASDNPAQYVYVGRNIMHEDRENGVDLKYVKDIVISQNVLWGYQDATTSDGSAMVLGSDGMPNRPWVIFNEVYDSHNGIRNEETDSAWIIGNKIYDIEGFAIGLEKKSDDLYIIGNTIYNVNVSIDQFWRETFRLHIFNNVFYKMRKTTVHLNIESVNVAAASEMGNNLFWQDGGPVNIRWGSGNKKDYNSSSDFEGFAGGENNIMGDPLFTDTDNHDFNLQQGSAAIDRGIPHEVYDTFFNIHGNDIKVDFSGKVRPLGENWDIGAFEYGESTGIRQEHVKIPTTFAMQNYPNPFNPATTIHFDIPERSQVKLDIFNIAGQKIISLVDRYYSAGAYSIAWNGTDQYNRFVGSGVYLYRLSTENSVLTKKMLLVK